MTDSAPLHHQDGWHLDKKVPLGLIFTILVQAGMVIWAIADIKKDVEVLKTQITVLHDRDNAQEANNRLIVEQVRAQMDRIDAKLDRLIERSSRQ
jgi:hypothetical protein